MVYLLQEGPFLKIGWSGQTPWDRRLHQIRNATPYDVTVLAARVGTLEQEQELHRNTRAENSAWHHRGDWYHDCPELRVYLDRFFYPEVWTCPDCGFDQMPYPPKDYHICPKCMVEFGNDDKASLAAGDPSPVPSEGRTDDPQEGSGLHPDVKAFFNFETSDLSPECNCGQEFRTHICFVHEGPKAVASMKEIFGTGLQGYTWTAPE